MIAFTSKGSTMNTAMLLILLSGCKKDDVEPVTAVTYNAGLAVGFVDAAIERADGVAQAVADMDADLICVEEWWRPEHIAQLAQYADAGFPYQVFPDAQQESGEGAACPADQIDPLIECAEVACVDSCVDDLVDCVFTNCVAEFFSADQTCQGCLMASVGGTLDEIDAACSEGDVHYAFDGSFGIGLLSRYEITDSEFLVLDSTTNRRGVIHAVIDAPGQPYDAYCTHLTANLAPIPYTGPSGDWVGEQAVQIPTMLDWADSTAQTDRQMLLGDFNAGPETADAVAELSNNYELFGGLPDPYVDQVGECTFCPDNPIASVYPSGDGVLIDHIFLDGWGDGSTTSLRVMDEPITTESCGESLEARWSDHYGVSVTWTPADE